MLTQKIIFICCKQIDTERTSSAIYHLLRGRKSIQSVQDAHNYKLTSFYGILPTISKQAYDEKINKYVFYGWLSHTKESDENEFISLTEKGRKWLQDQETLTLQGFNGLKFAKIDQLFYKRLILLVQIITNRKANNSSYIPIVDDTAIVDWAKKMYRKIRYKIDETNTMLYNELKMILHGVSHIEATIFVARLTGYNQYGLSADQLASQYNVSVIEIELMLTRTIHQMLMIISNDVEQFQLLSYIQQDLVKQSYLTNSADKTYDLLNNGYTIRQIAHIRQLKENTIYDHLVEVSLYDVQFPFNDYIDSSLYKKIVQVVQQTNSFKLKEIKSKVDDQISYFQIRLALAKRSHEQGGGQNTYKD